MPLLLKFYFLKTKFINSCHSGTITSCSPCTSSPIPIRLSIRCCTAAWIKLIARLCCGSCAGNGGPVAQKVWPLCKVISVQLIHFPWKFVIGQRSTFDLESPHKGTVIDTRLQTAACFTGKGNRSFIQSWTSREICAVERWYVDVQTEDGNCDKQTGGNGPKILQYDWIGARILRVPIGMPSGGWNRQRFVVLTEHSVPAFPKFVKLMFVRWLPRIHPSQKPLTFNVVWCLIDVWQRLIVWQAHCKWPNCELLQKRITVASAPRIQLAVEYYVNAIVIILISRCPQLWAMRHSEAIAVLSILTRFTWRWALPTARPASPTRTALFVKGRTF